MRCSLSVAVVIVIGCTRAPKASAPVENGLVRPDAHDASAADPTRTMAPVPSMSAASSPAPPRSSASPSEPPTPSTSASPPAVAPHAATEPRPTAADKRACTARGGTIQPICMMGELACVIRYRDGGKLCTDKRDCIGECLYEGPDPAPPKAIGTCQRTSDPCGCKAPIHHGQVEPALCAD